MKMRTWKKQRGKRCIYKMLLMKEGTHKNKFWLNNSEHNEGNSKQMNWCEGDGFQVRAYKLIGIKLTMAGTYVGLVVLISSIVGLAISDSI